MASNIKNHLSHIKNNMDAKNTVIVSGILKRISGMKIEATGISVPINTLCQIHVSDHHIVNAEVIGFSDKITYLMALDNMDGITPGAFIIPMHYSRKALVGPGLLGRIINAVGQPIDGKGELNGSKSYPLAPPMINPLSRKKITEPLDVGIKAINGLLTVGKGQRIGIFAGSGVGKSVLLAMMTRFTSAEVVVVGLIGERGREVKEFIEENLGELGLAKSVVVASPADTSPLMKVNGAILATTIAEYYRDQGLNVLLILDSLTRFAQAQREISLSVGELPATKGYTPSVFAKISQLVERSGNGMEGAGSITAFYTVLVEGDDQNDPIGDHVRSVLDGHIVLTRSLADAGHYPAIDIEKSISRIMLSVTSNEHGMVANKFKKLFSAYMQNKDLINVGMYQPGSDITIDEAIKLKTQFDAFLMQSIHESYSFSECLTQLTNLFLSE